jgi:hypothetical protein
MEFAEATEASVMDIDMEPEVQPGALIMSAKTSIAAVAAILTVLAAPAFASDQVLPTGLQDGGRYFGIDYTADPQHLSGAYSPAAEATRRSSSIGWAPREIE